MNIHARTKMEVNEAVARGAAIMEEMEADAAKHVKLASELRSLMKAVHDAGHIGVLENAAMGMDIEAMAHRYRADLFIYHSKATLRAQALGIDLPQRDGGR